MAGGLRTRMGLGLLSIAGTTAGHYLSYWLVAPDSHHRDELLEATGHAGESPFVILSVAALLATCVAVLGGRTTRTSGLLPTLIRLAALQLLAFGILETTERVIEGTPLLDAAREPVVWLGLLVQIAVAAAGAGLLRALHRAAAFGGVTAPPRITTYEIGAALDGVTALFSRNTGRHWEARGPPRTS